MKKFEKYTKEALVDEYLEIKKQLKEEWLEDEEPEFEIKKYSAEEGYKSLKGMNEVLPIKNYLSRLDIITHGYAPGELIIIAGQTGRGKSLLLINMIFQMAYRDCYTPSLFISLEMTKAQTAGRFVALMDATHYKGEYEALPIYGVYNKSEVNLKLLDSAIEKAIELFGIKFVAIDHLHYFVPPGAEYIQQIDKAVREIKQLAIKHNIPIFLISHTRKIQTSEPNIEDLKSTSATAQDADMVIMVDMDDEQKNLKVRVLKNRNRGSLGSTELYIKKPEFLLQEIEWREDGKY